MRRVFTVRFMENWTSICASLVLYLLCDIHNDITNVYEIHIVFLVNLQLAILLTVLYLLSVLYNCVIFYSIMFIMLCLHYVYYNVDQLLIRRKKRTELE